MMLERGRLRLIVAIVLCLMMAALVAVAAGDEISQLQRKADTGDPEALYRLAGIYARGEGVPKDFDKASEYLVKAADLGHLAAKRALDNPKLLLEQQRSDPKRSESPGMGSAPLEQSRETAEWKKAVSLLEKSLEKHPKNPEAYLDLSRGYQNLGQMDRALKAADNAVALDSRNAVAFGQRAIVYKLTRNSDQALKDFTRATELDQHYAWAHAQVADLMLGKGKLEQALESANKAVNAKPGFHEVIRLRAWILTRMGRCQDARDDFNKVMNLLPQRAQIHDKAWFLLMCSDDSMRDAAKALALAKKGAELTNEENGIVQEALAEAYFINRNYPKAVEHQKRAIELQKKTCPDGSCVQAMTNKLKRYETAAREESMAPNDVLPNDSAY